MSSDSANNSTTENMSTSPPCTVKSQKEVLHHQLEVISASLSHFRGAPGPNGSSGIQKGGSEDVIMQNVSACQSRRQLSTITRLTFLPSSGRSTKPLLRIEGRWRVCMFKLALSRVPSNPKDRKRTPRKYREPRVRLVYSTDARAIVGCARCTYC